MKLFYILTLLVTLVGTRAAQPLGAIRMNSDTTGTNTRSSAVIITNLSGSGNTGVMLRDSQHTNSVKVLSLTGDRVAIVASDKTLTNSFITVTWLNALSNIVGNIQDQIDNIISGSTNNWMNEGSTNSTLAGIGKPWALEVTNSVQVGALGEAGVIELTSTNGTYTVSLTLDANGTLTAAYGSTNMLTLQVGAASGYGGGGTKYLADGGAFVTPSSPIGTVTNININPTDGYIPYRSNSTTFGDSTIIQAGTNNILTGRVFPLNPVFSGIAASNYVGSLLPTASWPGFLAVSDFSADGLGKGKLSINSIDSSGGNGSAYFDVTATTTASATNANAKLYSGRSSGSVTRVWEFNTDPYTAANNYFRFQSNSVSTITIDGSGQVIFGPGTTNVLSRSTSDLTYTNGAAEVDINVLNGSGNRMSLGLNAGGNGLLDSSSGFIYLGDVMVANDIRPGNATTDIGQNNVSSGQFRNIVGQNLYSSGSDDGAGNYERLMIDHQGASGIVFESQAGGTGVARNFNFTGGTLNSSGINVLSRAYGAACSDLTTPLTTGTVKGIIRLPHAMTLTAVRASLLTAQTGGATFTVDIEENGTTVLSTPITIDNGETTSTTAAVPPVISDSALADDSIITLDITQVGDGTAVGLQFWIIGTVAP